MDTGEYDTVQIKKESESDVFDKVFDLSKVKYEPSEIGVFGESGKFDDASKNKRYLEDHRYAFFKYKEEEDKKFCVESECKTEHEDIIDIHYNDVKAEIIDETPGDRGLCEECKIGVLSLEKGKKETPTDVLVNHHMMDIAERQHVCKICSKPLSHSSRLMDQEKTLTEEKQFHCEICYQAFIHSKSLKAHQKIHTGEKPFHCIICGKTFNDSSNLKVHVRIHTGEKPFQCKICAKAFVNSSNLKVHERVHTGEKPYRCNMCAKSFSHSHRLRTHEMTHTEEKLFYCQICFDNFKNLYSLKAHESIHIGEN